MTLDIDRVFTVIFLHTWFGTVTVGEEGGGFDDGESANNNACFVTRIIEQKRLNCHSGLIVLDGH